LYYKGFPGCDRNGLSLKSAPEKLAAPRKATMQKTSLSPSLREPDNAASRLVEEGLRVSTAWLLRQQSPEGFWAGNVDSNSCIEAQWLLAGHILGVTLPIHDGVVQTLLNRQRPDGSWEIYPGAPGGDINSTVEVYAALRACGYRQDHPVLERARAWILAAGGLKKVRVFTRYWLSMIGVWPWPTTPNLPPEIIRFPLWFPFNIYNFAQWARATMVPLAVLSARRPVWPLPGGDRLEELFPDGYDNFDFSADSKATPVLSLKWLFRVIDRGLHALQSRKLIPFRQTAIKLCLEWMVKHQDHDGAWGGIQPPWIYGLIALRNEGYALNHPVLAQGLRALTSYWSFERGGSIHIQCTESSVWDTLFCLLALSEAGHGMDTPAMQRGVRWILDQQVLVPGDWSVKAPDLEPGGWAFERANNFYPDVDDTALALLVLARVREDSGAMRPQIDRAIARGVKWAFGMQSSNGGWAAFDRDNNKKIISMIPFCNFGEALDPPSVDVTAHLLEAFGELGMDSAHPPIARALAFIRSEQERDGSWFGRWGVNYIYGTGAVLPGLKALKQDMHAPSVKRAVAWLQTLQNADGGWGESCASYMLQSARGRGDSTPSQTSWALLALMAVGDPDLSEHIARGVEYLVNTVKPDGTWDENFYTATGFPGYGVGQRVPLDDPELFAKLEQGPELSRGFMLSFNMYRHYFPMLALARARHYFKR
jgi:squalene-hopene/tetraprenyl-beta-curcumene cyclase